MSDPMNEQQAFAAKTEWLTANAAAQLSTSSATGPAITPFMDNIMRAIEVSARMGERNVVMEYSWGKHPIGSPTEAQRRGIKQRLISLGYEVKYHEGDQRDPREVSYHMITW